MATQNPNELAHLLLSSPRRHFQKKTKHALKTETKNKNLKLPTENIIIKLEIFEFNKQNEMKQK